MRIGIVVPGRLHGFDLARGLLGRGHEVVVFTNYPVWAARRLGLPGDRIRSCWWNGVLVRLADLFARVLGRRIGEAALHRMFGRWAAQRVSYERWDVVYVWSGVAEELLATLKDTGIRIWLIRSSAHIREQAELLGEEEERAGVRIDRPSPWMIDREEREYALAARIQVPSTFAERTFLERGFPPAKLRKVALAADLGTFRPDERVIEARCARLTNGMPLRVLYVGNVSFQKGVLDLARIVEQLDISRFVVCAAGAVMPECRDVVARAADRLQFIGKRSPEELPRIYGWADMFVFPTIQDGYGVVLAQARANALPILTTTNCGGPDIVEEHRSGWILPIRDPEGFVERLQWCDLHRPTLTEMVRRIYGSRRGRDWTDVAMDLERLEADGA